MNGAGGLSSDPAVAGIAQPFHHFEKPFLVSLTSDYIAVFKPAGMHSTPASSKHNQSLDKDMPADLVSWMESELPDHANAFRIPADLPLSRAPLELGMLSRLDRDTSGLILCARSIDVMRGAIELQRSGMMRKFYRLVASLGEANLPGARPQRKNFPARGAAIFPAQASSGAGMEIKSFFRSYGEKGAKVACVSPEEAVHEKKTLSGEVFSTFISRRGKDSVDEFLADESAENFEAMIRAGFRHQIRAHMAWIGYPIAGDRLYGGRSASRLFLECHRVEIDLPKATPLIFEFYDNKNSERII